MRILNHLKTEYACARRYLWFQKLPDWISVTGKDLDRKKTHNTRKLTALVYHGVTEKRVCLSFDLGCKCQLLIPAETSVTDIYLIRPATVEKCHYCLSLKFCKYEIYTRSNQHYPYIYMWMFKCICVRSVWFYVRLMLRYLVSGENNLSTKFSATKSK